MNKNDQDFLVQKIRSQYTEKENTELDEDSGEREVIDGGRNRGRTRRDADVKDHDDHDHEHRDELGNDAARGFLVVPREEHEIESAVHEEGGAEEREIDLGTHEHFRGFGIAHQSRVDEEVADKEEGKGETRRGELKE